MATTKHKLTLTEIIERPFLQPGGSISSNAPATVKEESVVYQQNFEDLDVNALIRELNKTKRRRKVIPGATRANAPV